MPARLTARAPSARALGTLVLLTVLATLLFGARAEAAAGTWERAWGKNVNGGGVFGICTLPASCLSGTAGVLGGELNFPRGIATDSSGNVYVADQSNNRIQKFNSSGTWERAWGKNVNGGGVFGVCTVASSCLAGTTGALGGEMSSPADVTTDSSGNVYVSDTNNHRIQKFNSSGTWERAWGKNVNGGGVLGVCTVAASCLAGTTGGLGGEMNGPVGVETDAGGNVYVADLFNQRIQKFNSSGTWERAWGKNVNGGGVFGICTVASSCLAGTTGALGGEMNGPVSVDTDAGASVYVSDQSNNRIQKFNSSGTWERAWGKNVNGGGVFGICTVASSCLAGTTGGLGGEMSFPRALGTDSGGNVYVADANNSRIQKFDPSRPTISTSATANATIGGVISDQATLSGASSPTGTISFTAYGPNDANCSGAAAYTSTATNNVSGNGTVNNSPAFIPATAGTYRWRASYSGDTNHPPVSTPCNDTNETSVVAKASPTITTQATAGAPMGASISDEATLSGGSSPGGTITFTAYGPNDATCANAPAYTSAAVPVSGNDTYDNSPTFSPAAIGTYQWRASYSGDTNNNPVSTPCNDTNETSVVAKASPTITTQATASAAIGASISDQATLAGGFNPTGTITFSAYGPNDATCANTPAYTSSAVAVSGAGVYNNSPPFTPGAAGTYRWRASYSGDTNNNSVSTPCNDSGETSVVGQATPTITTSATANATVGGSISDQATLSGGSSPGGSITFRAYGPADATCANPPAYTSSAIAVSGNGDYGNSPAFTPANVGTYRWRASYSGDTNNATASTPCNDTNETSTVSKATPTLTTQATPSVILGEPIADEANLTGGHTPGGAITFTAYGPDDATCSLSPAYTSAAVPVSGNGTYANSPAFTPAAVGTYRWRASYSGDVANNAVAGACNAANESSEVSAVPIPPQIPTTPQTPTSTGQRAAALRKCKKKKTAAARRKCKRRAKRLPL